MGMLSRREFMAAAMSACAATELRCASPKRAPTVSGGAEAAGGSSSSSNSDAALDLSSASAGDVSDGASRPAESPTDASADADAQQDAAAGAIIDTHVHFFDPARPIPTGRPSSVPWPNPGDALYRTTLPADYLALAKPLGISSAIVIEASSWLEDNQWILDLIAGNPAFAGFVGNLSEVLGTATFDDTLTALARNALFRGIRVFASQLTGGDPSNFASLAATGLMIDVVGFSADLPAIAAFAQTLPSLRIVIDHVANVAIDGGAPPADWAAGIAAAGGQPNVYCKISGLVEGAGMTGAVSSDVAFYRPTLDTVWRAFGEDRVLFGSNWPVSSVNAALPAVLSIVRSYVDEKGSAASEKAFASNARAAYGV